MFLFFCNESLIKIVNSETLINLNQMNLQLFFGGKTVKTEKENRNKLNFFNSVEKNVLSTLSKHHNWKYLARESR